MTARPIRIVPLHRPSELFVPGRPAKAPAAQLTYRGGPLLTSVQVFSVFWGAAWQDPAQQSLVQGLNGFLQFVVSSAYLDQLSEYNTPDQAIGHGRYPEPAPITDPPPAPSLSDSPIPHTPVR